MLRVCNLCGCDFILGYIEYLYCGPCRKARREARGEK